MAWGVAGLAIAPILLGYRSIHAFYGFKRSPVEVLNYSADIAGLWSAAPDSLMWSRLHGGAASESEQFPGLTILLLFASGVVVTLRSFRLKAEATERGDAGETSRREKREAADAPLRSTAPGPPPGGPSRDSAGGGRTARYGSTR